SARWPSRECSSCAGRPPSWRPSPWPAASRTSPRPARSRSSGPRRAARPSASASTTTKPWAATTRTSSCAPATGSWAPEAGTVSIPFEPPRRTIGLARIIEVVRRRFLLALVPFAFVVVAGLSLAAFLPSLWTAKSTILVDRQKIPESFVKSTITTDVEAQLLGLSQQIMSSGQLLKIIEAHDLYRDLRRKRSAEDVVERMRRDIRIEFQNDDRDKRNPRTIGFSVLYTTTTPAMAMTIANELAALYVNEDVRYREKHAVSTSEFLDTQLKEVRERLQNQERRVAEFKERYMGELPEQRE